MHSESNNSDSNSNSNRSNSRRRPLYPGWGSGNVAYVGTLRAHSMAVLGRASLEIGDKIILPQQTLQSINRLRLPFPLIFEIRKYSKHSSKVIGYQHKSKSNNFNNVSSENDQILNAYKRRIEDIYRSTNPSKVNKVSKWLMKYKDNPHDLYLRICKTYSLKPKSKIGKKNKNFNSNSNSKLKSKRKSKGKQFCSVYEFSSPQPESAYIPHWMMENIGIEEGDRIEIQSQFNINKGTFCKLQPFKQSFMDKVSTVNNGYKSTLEHSLRHYSVLSVNQRIVVEFNHCPYQCIIKELKPNNVVSILGSTDLEIEFDEALESITSKVINENINTDINMDQKEASPSTISSHDNSNNDNNDNNNNNMKDEESDCSSFGLSDIENIDVDNNNHPKIYEASEIDGELLKKLGVPLNYKEQTQLASIIIENRRLIKENESLDGDHEEDEDEDEDDDLNHNLEEKQETITDVELTPIGPNDIKCGNCAKYVNSMSITMHQIHCQRNFMKCDICNECINKKEKDEHFDNNHREYSCLCTKVFSGFNTYSLHKNNECLLRLMKCKMCKKDNIEYRNYDSHILSCGDEEIVCDKCNKQYILKNEINHDCGALCVLCGDRINDSKDKLLHLLTSCSQRRAICEYCGLFRQCTDMEEHRKFCGSRSEKCEKCNQYVSLMNMEPHEQSNCEWFNNNQISKQSKNKSVIDNNLANNLESLSINNPYLDNNLLSNNSDESSLFGLLQSNHQPNIVNNNHNNNDSFSVSAIKSSSLNKQICPHCKDDDSFLDEEEFQIHIAMNHADKINSSMTQVIIKSFKKGNDILNNKLIKKKKKKINQNNKEISIEPKVVNFKPQIGKRSSKKKKRLSTINKNDNKIDLNKNKNKKITNIKTKKWNCPTCTFVNTFAKRKCMMCETQRPRVQKKLI